MESVAVAADAAVAVTHASQLIAYTFGCCWVLLLLLGAVALAVADAFAFAVAVAFAIAVAVAVADTFETWLRRF